MLILGHSKSPSLLLGQPLRHAKSSRCGSAMFDYAANQPQSQRGTFSNGYLLMISSTLQPGNPLGALIHGWPLTFFTLSVRAMVI